MVTVVVTVVRLDLPLRSPPLDLVLVFEPHPHPLSLLKNEALLSKPGLPKIFVTDTAEEH